MNDPLLILRILKLRFVYQCKNWDSWNYQTKKDIWFGFMNDLNITLISYYYDLAGKVIADKYGLNIFNPVSIYQILETFELAEKYINNKAFL